MVPCRERAEEESSVENWLGRSMARMPSWKDVEAEGEGGDSIMVAEGVGGGYRRRWRVRGGQIPLQFRGLH